MQILPSCAGDGEKLSKIKKEAKDALARIKGAGSDESRVVADEFTRVSALADVLPAKITAEMAKAAADAAHDSGSASAIHRIGLEAMADGTAACAGPLAALALRMMNAGYLTPQSQNRHEIARAAAGVMASLVPEEETRRKAALICRLMDAAIYWNSSIAAAQAALSAMGGGTLLGSVAAAVLGRQAASLRPLASAMVAAGTEGQKGDDRALMAAQAVQFLASADGGADPVCRMAKDATAGMHFRDTSRDVAILALDSQAGNDAAGLAKIAGAMLEKAYLGNDSRGKWIDEKKPVAEACLQFISQESAGTRAGDLAGLGLRLVEACAFSKSSEAAAGLVFNVLSKGRSSDSDAAALVLDAMESSLACDNASGRYQDDKSPVARAAADWLASSGTTVDSRKWGDLQKAVLDPSKFTKSNEGLARAGFGAIKDQLRFDDRSLARTARAMVEGSLNSDNASGKFQADKSTVVNVLIPFLEKELKEEPSQRILKLWKAAESNLTFAVSGEKIALACLDAIASGAASDRELAALSRKLVADAYAGQTSGYAYRDDKTRVALQAAQYLSSEAKDADVKALAHFLQDALDGTTFTDTCVAVSDAVLREMSDGTFANVSSLAKLGREMVKKSLAATSSSGKYQDDKTVVTRNVLASLHGIAQDRETRTLVLLAKNAIDKCAYTESCEKIADLGLAALSKSGRKPSDFAGVAKAAINSGAESYNKQDKGPIAVSVFETLSRTSPDAPTALGLDGARALMSNGASITERVNVAEAALDAWARQAGKPLEPFSFIETALSASKDEEARWKMLSTALPVLAASKGAEAERKAKERVEASLKSSTYDQAVSHLIDYLHEVSALQSPREEIEKMVERLKPSEPAVEQKVDSAPDSDFVVIGGVRLRKRADG
jgi:hypothetical protein